MGETNTATCDDVQLGAMGAVQLLAQPVYGQVAMVGAEEMEGKGGLEKEDKSSKKKKNFLYRENKLHVS